MFKIFDTHIHTSCRTTQDLENMAIAGVVAVLEPSFWLGSDRKYPQSFLDYFEHLITFETERCKKFGIKHYVAIGLNPKEANDIKMAREVVSQIEKFLNRENVIAVGEIGFDRITKEEEEIFVQQLLIAEKHKMPIIIHTPHQYKYKGTERTMQIIEELKLTQERIIIDHNTEETLPLVRKYNVWANHSLYPITKLTPERMVEIVKQYGLNRMLVSSAADWGVSDPLAVPKLIQLMRKHNFTFEEIDTLVYKNPVKFFSCYEKFSIEN
jgi:predicted metal-dependent TIM-barrel fold hydrolase